MQTVACLFTTSYTFAGVYLCRRTTNYYLLSGCKDNIFMANNCILASIFHKYFTGFSSN